MDFVDTAGPFVGLAKNEFYRSNTVAALTMVYGFTLPVAHPRAWRSGGPEAGAAAA